MVNVFKTYNRFYRTYNGFILANRNNPFQDIHIVRLPNSNWSVSRYDGGKLLVAVKLPPTVAFIEALRAVIM